MDYGVCGLIERSPEIRIYSGAHMHLTQTDNNTSDETFV